MNMKTFDNVNITIVKKFKATMLKSFEFLDHKKYMISKDRGFKSKFYAVIRI